MARRGNDGRRVAFTRIPGFETSNNPSYGLYVTDGSDPPDRLDRRSGLVRYDLAWSADSTTIAFDGSAQTRDIWTIRADGSHLRRLTRGPADDYGPAWLP